MKRTYGLVALLGAQLQQLDNGELSRQFEDAAVLFEARKATACAGEGGKPDTNLLQMDEAPPPADHSRCGRKEVKPDPDLVSPPRRFRR